jgi:metallo-beta-lactamase family protein
LVKILGERVIVRAKIFTIGGLSAHADQSALLDWLSHFENPKMRVYVVHGEESVSEEFAKLIRQKFGFESSVPAIGDRITPTALERPAVFPEAGEPRWRGYVAKLLRKTEEIRNVLEDSGSQVAPHEMQRLEEELISAEAHLDEALQSVEKSPRVET